MWIQNFFKSLTSSPSHRRPMRGRMPASRLCLEQLEDRTVPSNFTAATSADLIADINAANQQGGSNTITLVAYSLPFVLDDVDNTTHGGTDLPVIAANDNLTIIGNGNTIGGGYAGRLLDVASGAALTMENLTLEGGRAYGSGVWASGGAIYSQGSLTLNGVTVQGNTAMGGNGTSGSTPGYGSDGRGGGLYVAGGTATITNSTLSANQALGGPGGAAYTVFNYIDGPNGGNGGSGLGGAVYVAAGTVIMTGNTLSANTAQGGRGGRGGDAVADEYSGDVHAGDGGHGGSGLGGAVSVAAGTVIMTGNTWSANTAQGGSGGDGGWAYDQSLYGNLGHPGNGGTGGPGFGGGLYLAGGTVTLTGAAVSSNSALAGSGGPGGFAGYTPGITGNPGLGKGGGLYIAPAAPPLADLDTYTVSNTVNNVADIDPNISGPYSLNGTWLPPLAISDLSILEGNTGTTAFVFTVSIPTPISQAVSVNYATADGSATAGSDYQTAFGTLTIPAGETGGTIIVLVNGDRLPEANETFFVNLSSATNAVIADGQAMGAIADDEPRISVSTDYVTITEGNAGTTDAIFTVSLSTAYDQQVTVDYYTSDDSAIAGDDYVRTFGTLRFDAGQTSQMIRVPVIGDHVAESEEHFYLNLHNPSSNAAIIGGYAVGAILNDD